MNTHFLTGAAAFFALALTSLAQLPVTYDATATNANPTDQGWNFSGSSAGVSFVSGPPPAWQLSDTLSNGILSYTHPISVAEASGLLNTTGFRMTAKIRAVENHNTKFAGRDWCGFLEFRLPASLLPGSSDRRIGFAFGIGGSNQFQIFNEQNTTPTLVTVMDSANDFHTLEVVLPPGSTNYSWFLNDDHIATLPLNDGPAVTSSNPRLSFSSGTTSGFGGTFDILSFRIEELPPVVLHVDADATGANNGTSWTDAFTTLQDAITAAGLNHEIWVAEGTYYPDEGSGQTNSDRSSTFQLKNGVALYGGFAGTESLLSERNPDPATNNTILSGDLDQDDNTGGDNSENAYHVLTGDDIGATAILDGFTITGGNANGNFPDDEGGAIFNSFSSPSIANCSFQGNSSSDNAGAIYNRSSSPSIANCSFQGNSTGIRGGAIFNWSSSSPSIANCSFQGNSASSGGAIFNEFSSPSTANCSFQGNSAENGGGTIYNAFSSSPSLTNCSFQGNSAVEGGAIYNFSSSSPSLTNCIIWNNSVSGVATSASASVFNSSSTPTYSHCLIENIDLSGTGTGNFDGTDPSKAPLFVSATDLRIRAGSPAFDAGDNSANSTSTDLAGNSRTQNGTIDLGAYEIPFVSLPSAAQTVIQFPDGNAQSVSLFPDVSSFNPTPQYTLTETTNVGSLTPLNGTPRIDADGVLDIELAPGSTGTLIYTVELIDSDGVLATSSTVTLTIRVGNRLHVDADATGAGFGTTWNDAFPKLQDAISAALSGDEIWVAAGTYYPDERFGQPDGGRGSTFTLKSNVALYGGFSGTESLLSERNPDPATNNTILSGDLNQDDAPNFTNNSENAYHVLTAPFGSTSMTVDGFTITGGNANGSGLNSNGGAVLIRDSTSLTNCSFQGNSASSGGGAIYYPPAGGDSTISNCSFQDNFSGGDGGAIDQEFFATSLFISDCSFQSNSATNNGGAIFLSLSSEFPFLTNCSFQNNSAGDNGGAIYDNGAIAFEENSYINCSFQGNSASGDGGAISLVSTSNRSLINCSFQGNSADGNGGAIYNFSGGTSIVNSIIWNNSDITGTGTPSSSLHNVNLATGSFSHSLVANSGGSGPSWSHPFVDLGNNIDADPLFVSATDLRLLPNSPAFNAGLDSAYNSANNNSSTDLAGNLRIISAAIDLGAYEVPVVELEPNYQANVQFPDGTEQSFSLFPDVSLLSPTLGYTLTETSSSGPFTLIGTPRIDPDGVLDIQFTSGSIGTLIYDVLLSDSAGAFIPNPVVTLTIRIGNRLHVDLSATGLNTGPTWTDAFTNLQDALSIALSGDEIWVAQGTYYPDEGSEQTDGEREASFTLKGGVKVYGGFLGTESLLSERNPDPAANPSILSGDLDQNDGLNFANNAENAYNVVTLIGNDPTTLLDRFTITAGNANGSGGFGFGGGLSLTTDSLTLSDCLFDGNFASTRGGAVSNSGSSSSFLNCSFQNNSSSSGGAIFNFSSSSPSYTNCSFQGNSASSVGGAVRNDDSSPSFTNCSLQNNTSTNEGGAFYNINSTPSLTNCIIWDNFAFSSTTSPNASIFNSGSTPTYSHCLIANFSKTDLDNSGSSPDTNFAPTDPLFISITDLRLQAGSPALDVGLNSANTTTLDLDGNPRIQNATIDLGAYERPFSGLNFATLFPDLDPTADDNNNGQSNYLDYALGADPTAPNDPSVQPSLSNNQLTFSFRNNATDVFVEFQKSTTLLPDSWSELILGTDYTLSSESINGTTTTQTLNLLPLVTDEPVFFREGFSQTAP